MPYPARPAEGRLVRSNIIVRYMVNEQEAETYVIKNRAATEASIEWEAEGDLTASVNALDGTVITGAMVEGLRGTLTIRLLTALDDYRWLVNKCNLIMQAFYDGDPIAQSLDFEHTRTMGRTKETHLYRICSPKQVPAMPSNENGVESAIAEFPFTVGKRELPNLSKK